MKDFPNDNLKAIKMQAGFSSRLAKIITSDYFLLSDITGSYQP